MSEAWNKAERLIVAGQIAPAIRSQDEKKKTRRIGVRDSDWNIVRYVTLAELQKELLEKRGIELETQDGKRPTLILCAKCGRLIKVRSRGNFSKSCDDCRVEKCAICRMRLGWKISKTIIENRKDPRIMCKRCRSLEQKKRIGPRTGGRRKEKVTKTREVNKKG